MLFRATQAYNTRALDADPQFKNARKALIRIADEASRMMLEVVDTELSLPEPETLKIGD